MKMTMNLQLVIMILQLNFEMVIMIMMVRTIIFIISIGMRKNMMSLMPMNLQEHLPKHKLLVFTGPIDAFYASKVTRNNIY